MSLQDYDEIYDEATAFDKMNDFPDGVYEMEITRVWHECKPKSGEGFDSVPGDDVIFFQFDIVGGEFGGLPGRQRFAFGEKTAKISAQQLKYLLTAMKLEKFHPSAFNNEQFCRMFNGFIMKARKTTTHKGDKSYSNWGYWELVSPPEREGVSDGSEFDDIDTTSPPSDTATGEEIELNEEPF